MTSAERRCPMRQAYRYEMDPNRAQAHLLRCHCGWARFAYNWALDKNNKLWDEKKPLLRSMALMKLWTQERPEWARNGECSRQVVEGAMRNLDAAFANFRRNSKNPAWVNRLKTIRRRRKLRTNKPPGYPEFKVRGKKESATFFNPGSNSKKDYGALRIRIEGDRAVLPTLGSIKLKEQPRVKGLITQATVRLEVDRWYVALMVERNRKSPGPRPGPVIAAALGIEPFATFDTGEEIQAPRPLFHRLDRIRRLTRIVTRRSVDYKGRRQRGGPKIEPPADQPREEREKKVQSKNWAKAVLRLGKANRKIRHIRLDFIHKLTERLTKNYSRLVIQDFKVTEMQKPDKADLRNDPDWVTSRSLRRSISDMGWYTFKELCRRKAEFYGCDLVVADPDYPSAKRCSGCGNVKESFPLSERIYVCEKCGMTLKRGLNAAYNLAAYGRGQTTNGTANQAGT